MCDAVRGCVTVFERTPYAQAIEDADSLFRRQDYDASRQRWEDTLRMNCNFELAYIQIGRILYRQDAYGEAMDYFKKGNFRGENYVSGYGMAFEKYRAVFLQENLQLILTILAAAAGGIDPAGCLAALPPEEGVSRCLHVKICATPFMC